MFDVELSVIRFDGFFADSCALVSACCALAEGPLGRTAPTNMPEGRRRNRLEDDCSFLARVLQFHAQTVLG